MAYFQVFERIDAPVERVWSVLLDWEGSSAWMVDATTVEVVGTQREGVGTRVRAVTRVAVVIPLTDVMVVTEWIPFHLIRVRHLGWPIRGDAWFRITPDGDGTMFEWAEDLVPPLGVLGEIGGAVLRAPIRALLRASAAKLKAVCEAP